MVSPSALVVLRLTTVYTVGNWTGSSVGVAPPLKVLSTYPATAAVFVGQIPTP